MNSITDHYETHLAPVYVWMSGGVDAAFARADAEIADLLPEGALRLSAMDLGAGFGTHAVPLARRGCSVVAVDSSALLLGELRRLASELPVKAVQDDLLNFQRHVSADIDLIIIMGDTLTHLSDRGSVRTLMARAAESLRAGVGLLRRSATTPPH